MTDTIVNTVTLPLSDEDARKLAEIKANAVDPSAGEPKTETAPQQ